MQFLLRRKTKFTLQVSHVAMKQIEVDNLVAIIDEMQANYWRYTKKGKIVIVDTTTIKNG